MIPNNFFRRQVMKSFFWALAALVLFLIAASVLFYVIMNSEDAASGESSQEMELINGNGIGNWRIFGVFLVVIVCALKAKSQYRLERRHRLP